MRWLIVLAGALPMLAGCGGAEESLDENALASDYSPPTVTSRLDFGGAIERRFQRFDADADGRITPDELPERFRAAVPRGDQNGDNALDAAEWSDLMLSWFDENDLNKDGSLTSEERDTARERRGATAGQTTTPGNSSAGNSSQ